MALRHAGRKLANRRNCEKGTGISQHSRRTTSYSKLWPIATRNSIETIPQRCRVTCENTLSASACEKQQMRWSPERCASMLQLVSGPESRLRNLSAMVFLGLREKSNIAKVAASWLKPRNGALSGTRALQRIGRRKCHSTSVKTLARAARNLDENVFQWFFDALGNLGTTCKVGDGRAAGRDCANIAERTLLRVC